MNELMTTTELKERLINIADQLDATASDLMAKGCADETTGNIRAYVCKALEEAHQKIKNEIYNIY